jgi:tight adherence protein B
MYLPALICVTVTVGVAAGYQPLSNLLFPSKSPVRRRLAEEFRKGAPASPRPALFTKLDQLGVDPLSGGMSDLGMAELPPPPTRGDWGWRARLQELLDQADLRWPVGRLLLLSALAAVALGVGAYWLGGVWLACFAALAGAAAPPAFVSARGQARRRKFLHQLPEAFELMARVLQSGHSAPPALQAVADSMEQPIAGEFAQCQKQQNLGLRPELAFQDMARRIGIVEMRIFVMAVLLKRQVGGNLSDVLERLAMLVRARLRLRDQVRTLTAEGRLQGLALVVLPFVMFGALLVVNRAYALTLFEHVPLLIGMGALMLVGVVWIRKIVHFEA